MTKEELHATLEKLAREYPWDYLMFGKDARHESCDRTFEVTQENMALRAEIAELKEKISRLEGCLELERKQFDALANHIQDKSRKLHGDDDASLEP